MKKAIRILLALTVATMIAGGAFAGSAAATTAQDTQIIEDNDLIDADANALNVNTATSASAVNVGGDQTSTAVADQDNRAGNTYIVDS